MKIRKVPVLILLELLDDLYDKGVDYIDIHGKALSENEDALGVSFLREYMDEECIGILMRNYEVIGHDWICDRIARSCVIANSSRSLLWMINSLYQGGRWVPTVQLWDLAAALDRADCIRLMVKYDTRYGPEGYMTFHPGPEVIAYIRKRQKHEILS